MDCPTRIACVVCGLLAFAAAPAVAEDVTITYKVAYGEPGSPIRTKYISPGKAEAWSGPDYGFITDNAGTMTRIDHARGQYTETSQQEDEAASRLLQRLPRRDAPVKNSSVTVEKLGDHRSVAGHDCEHYVVTTRREWHDTTPPRIVVNRHDYWIAAELHLETARARMFEMGARILQDAPDDVMNDVLSKGLVLAERWSVNYREMASEEATEVKTGPIDASVFRPPPAYTKVESLSASLIRESADVEYSAIGTCSRTLFIALGRDDDENAAWDATKKAWRNCVSERLGEAWTVVERAKKQCHPRKEKLTWARVTAQGTEIVSCREGGGDPNGKWVCLLDAVPCTAPTTPR
jgi:hypothetical protein